MSEEEEGGGGGGGVCIGAWGKGRLRHTPMSTGEQLLSLFLKNDTGKDILICDECGYFPLLLAMSHCLSPLHCVQLCIPRIETLGCFFLQSLEKIFPLLLPRKTNLRFVLWEGECVMAMCFVMVCVCTVMVVMVISECVRSGP